MKQSELEARFLEDWERWGSGIAPLLEFPLSEIADLHGYDFTEIKLWKRCRFDFAWPESRLLVEVDGFGYGHQSQQDISRNQEKRNIAIEHKWRVLAYTSRQLGSLEKRQLAIEQVVRTLFSLTSQPRSGHNSA